jgi:cysteine synthase
VVALALHAPYYLDATEIGRLSAYYAVYSKVEPSLIAALRAVFQEITPVGASPVSVEGIGYDFIPDVLEYDNIDDWIYSNDEVGFKYARRLIREEGLLVGGSSGSAIWGTLEAIKKYPDTKKALTILPDSIRNYLTKFVNDDWMKEHGFPIDD